MSAATAAKPLPTPEQLKAYVDQLPEIYRDVLSTFATAGPSRIAGDGLAFGTIANHLVNQGRRYRPEELTLALRQLTEAEFLDDQYDRIEVYAPTPVGEELVTTLTGRRAVQVTVPDLPRPGW